MSPRPSGSSSPRGALCHGVLEPAAPGALNRAAFSREHHQLELSLQLEVLLLLHCQQAGSVLLHLHLLVQRVSAECNSRGKPKSTFTHPKPQRPAKQRPRGETSQPRAVRRRKRIQNRQAAKRGCAVRLQCGALLRHAERNVVIGQLPDHLAVPAT